METVTVTVILLLPDGFGPVPDPGVLDGPDGEAIALLFRAMSRGHRPSSAPKDGGPEMGLRGEAANPGQPASAFPRR